MEVNDISAPVEVVVAGIQSAPVTPHRSQRARIVKRCTGMEATKDGTAQYSTCCFKRTGPAPRADGWPRREPEKTPAADVNLRYHCIVLILRYTVESVP